MIYITYILLYGMCIVCSVFLYIRHRLYIYHVFLLQNVVYFLTQFAYYVTSFQVVLYDIVYMLCIVCF